MISWSNRLIILEGVISVGCNILKDEEGSIAVIVVLVMTVLLGFSALVVDMGLVALEKQKLQNAVDAACLAAVRDLPDASAATATANRYIELNGYKASDITIDFSDSNQTINISASKEVNYNFAKILGFNSTSIHPSAGATKESLGAAFNYTLFSGNPSYTLTINGSGFYVGGSAHSNYRFTINGSNITITEACEAVSTLTTNGSSINIANIIRNASVVEMPDFSDEIKTQADKAGQAYMGSKTFNGSQMSVDSPIYVDGNVTINGSNFKGKGCILATGNITFNGSNLNSSSDDAVCFYSKNGSITINGSSAVLDGILYAPKGTITMNGSNQVIHGRVIGDKVALNGSGIRIIGGTSELMSLPSSSAKLIK